MIQPDKLNAKEMIMDICKKIDNSMIKNKKYPLLAAVLMAMDEIEASGRITIEVVFNLRNPLGTFFEAENKGEQKDCLVKIATEISLHDDVSSQTEIYEKLLEITGLK